jgi:FkbM family methyltransferase
MIVQRALLKLLSSGLLPAPASRIIQSRAWTIERGEAAGLQIVFPQNLDFIDGSSELPVQRCVSQHVQPGGVFYDVGANVGFFSLLAGRRVGPGGAVYAFEPVSENATTVRRNTSLNQLENISVFEVAVDEKARTAELFITKWDGGSSLSRDAIPSSQLIEPRSVQVVALDDFIAHKGLRPPTMVKVDVEGAEMGALRGMLNTLKRFRPVVLYEIDDRDRASMERRRGELDTLVTGLGYRITHLEHSYTNVHWHVAHSLAIPDDHARG